MSTYRLLTESLRFTVGVIAEVEGCLMTDELSARDRSVLTRVHHRLTNGVETAEWAPGLRLTSAQARLLVTHGIVERFDFDPMPSA